MAIVLGIINSVLIAGYPLAVYFGLSAWGPRPVAVLLAACIVPGLCLRLWTTAREHLWPVLRIPLTILLTLAVGGALDDSRMLLAMPVLINAVLLANFATSLRGEVSMVERFARMQEPDLPPGGVAYCRKVTVVWCGFFLANGATAGILALMAPLSWWTLYTGFLAYILIGLMFTIEFVTRKLIFRQFGRGFPDRLLAWLLGHRYPAANNPAGNGAHSTSTRDPNPS